MSTYEVLYKLKHVLQDMPLLFYGAVPHTLQQRLKVLRRIHIRLIENINRPDNVGNICAEHHRVLRSLDLLTEYSTVEVGLVVLQYLPLTLRQIMVIPLQIFFRTGELPLPMQKLAIDWLLRNLEEGLLVHSCHLVDDSEEVQVRRVLEKIFECLLRGQICFLAFWQVDDWSLTQGLPLMLQTQKLLLLIEFNYHITIAYYLSEWASRVPLDIVDRNQILFLWKFILQLFQSFFDDDSLTIIVPEVCLL